MPTNKERREVARKLRETSDEIRDWCDTNPYWYVMKCIYGDVEIHDDNELFYRLADLIEPEPERTCRKVPGRMRYGERKPKCSECGYSLGDPRWFYCPKCGGKITNDRSDT